MCSKTPSTQKNLEAQEKTLEQHGTALCAATRMRGWITWSATNGRVSSAVAVHRRAWLTLPQTRRTNHSPAQSVARTLGERTLDLHST